MTEVKRWFDVVVVLQGAPDFPTPATERRYNVYPSGGVLGGVPAGVRGTSHLHQNVAAFGEITVMPVGGGHSDNENVRVAVDEELF